MNKEQEVLTLKAFEELGRAFYHALHAIDRERYVAIWGSSNSLPSNTIHVPASEPSKPTYARGHTLYNLGLLPHQPDDFECDNCRRPIDVRDRVALEWVPRVSGGGRVALTHAACHPGKIPPPSYSLSDLAITLPPGMFMRCIRCLDPIASSEPVSLKWTRAHPDMISVVHAKCPATGS